jgi:two-component system sensor histidine kinase KdpD
LNYTADTTRTLMRLPNIEVVLICVNDSEQAPTLVEAGRRLAGRLGARWIIVHVETLESTRRRDSERHRLTETLRAAQHVGGEAVNLAADDAAEAIAQFARSQMVTHVVIGTRRRTWRLSRKPGFIDRLSVALDDVCFQIVTARPADSPHPRPPRAPSMDHRTPASSYVMSMVLVATATAVAAAMRGFVGSGALSIVFLTAVLIAATEYGLGPALMASVLSMFLYDFFFIRPVFSLIIETPRDLTAFCAFTIASLIASRVGTRVRDQAYLARRRAAEASDLHQLTRGLAGAGTLDDVAHVAAARITATIDLPVVVMLPGNGFPASIHREPPNAPFSDDDLAAAQACLAAGRSESSPGLWPSPNGWRFLAIGTGGKTLGVFGVREPERSLEIATEDRLKMIADQVAITVDRINLVFDLDRERQRDATDRLHAALLASISHDLRDPLTAILGSAETLDERWDALPEATRVELVGTVREEAERLALLVYNLLDMARLEGSAFRARLAPTSLSEIVEAALRQTAPLVKGFSIKADVAPDLPLLLLDPTLCEQVLFNIIDNATKFAPSGSTIRLTAWHDDMWAHLLLTDEGPGFPPDHIDDVFDKFFHLDTASSRKGAGLGLTICRGFVAAMDGHITAENLARQGGGAIRIRFPIPVNVPSPLPESAS